MITLLNKFDDNYIIQEKDVLDIANAYIKENNVSEYLKNVIFSNDSKYMGSYNIRTNEIVLNDEKILKFCYKMFDKLSNTYLINEDHYTYFLNFYYLYIIYHELMHVSQKAKFERDDNELFNYLYVLSSILHESDIVFYNKNHNLFPLEIEANNYGYLMACNLMNYTKLPTKEAKVMYLQYIFSVMLNYKKISDYEITSPIELLKEKNNIVNMDLINELLKQTKTSKIFRMSFGLPITSREFDSVDNEKYKTLFKTI